MSYSVHQADPRVDRESILTLWNENQDKTLDEKYQWFYLDNPGGVAKTWLLKHDDTGEFVGMASLFPRMFLVNGKPASIWVGGDLFIRKDHQLLAPAMMLTRRLKNDSNHAGIDAIYFLPNSRADPVADRAGFTCLGPTIRLVKVFKSTRHLKENGLRATTFLGPLLDLILRIASYDTWHYVSKQGFKFELLTDVDKRFDDLWNSIANRFSVVGARTSQYLHWKFVDDPDDENLIYAMFSPDKSSLLGYIIFNLERNSIQIRDLLFIDEKTIVNSLIAGFLRHIRKMNVESVYIVQLENRSMEKLFRRFGLVHRKPSRNVYYYAANKTLAPVLDNAQNWFLLQSDEDT